VRKTLEKLWPFAFTVFATLVVTRAWWNDQLLGGHSAYMDYFRQVVLHAATQEGDLWPRFAEAFYFGHGSLLFHFYAPLSYWFGEAFMLLGAGAAPAIKLTLALSILLSGVFAALLARDLFGPWAGAAAGTFYVMAPYHLVDVLVRHALGESIAFAWLPLGLWGVLGAVRQRSVGHMAAGAVGCAFLLLTHNITAMIGGVLLAGWWVYLAIRHFREGLRGPLMGALVGVFGLLLAAFFWLPAIVETDLVKSKRSLTQGYFVYWDHFVHFKQFFSPVWGFGGSRVGLDDSMSYQLGLAHWFGAAGVAWAWLRRREWRADIAFWAIALAVSLAMCHYVSGPVWRSVSLLAFVQFPWRFLVLAALAASILVSSMAQWLAGRFKQGVGVALAICFVLLPVVVYFPYATARHALYDVKDTRYRGYTAEKYAERAARTKRYERIEKTIDLEALKNRQAKATSRDDFLPVGVSRVQREPAGDRITAQRGTFTESRRVAPRHFRAEVSMRDEGSVVLHRYFYPGWRARIDGVLSRAFADPVTGLTTVIVPAGKHTLEFDFVGTKWWRLGWWLSALGVLGLAAAMALLRKKKLQP
jgi:6-pyruvoyl-tetrahydropterin synthase related domain